MQNTDPETRMVKRRVVVCADAEIFNEKERTADVHYVCDAEKAIVD